MCAEQHINVAIIIVNYRSARLVSKLLDSLLQKTTANIRVYVVDNASEDDSVMLLATKIGQPPFRDFCRFFLAKDNGGFSAGNNLILQRMLGKASIYADFIWLLNPDTTVKPGALDALLNCMATHANAGICGSQLFAVDGQPHVSAFRFHSLTTEALSAIRLGKLSRLFAGANLVQPVAGNKPIKTDWVPGASMLIKTALLREVGLLDENYFLYFEETDFCLAAHRAGWSCWLVPQSQVIHIEGQSTGIVQEIRKQRLPAYWFASRRYYFRKNYGLFYALLADSLWTAGYCSWLIRQFFQHKPNTDPPYLLRDFIRHGTLANLLSRRSLK